MARKDSLLNANPIHFSPVYLNADNVSTEKLLAFYRFTNLFFPKMGSNLVSTIMDMERHAERLTAHTTPHQRRKLVRDMKGVSMDMNLAISDETQIMMDISIHIVPSEVLKRAQQGRSDLVEYQQLSDDLDKLIVKLISKEIGRRFTAKVGGYFRAFGNGTQVPPFITQLLEAGWINRKGQLQPGATIDELLTGKYRKQFEELMPQEVVQQGMQIRETIAACFAMNQDSQDDPDSLVQDARRRHALLEITLREANRLGG